jgi:hypothetical protein
MPTAARTELPAAARFSARINSDEGMAGLPDIQKLSLLGGKSANKSRRQSDPWLWSLVNRKEVAGP